MSNKEKEWTVLSMLEWGTDFFKQKDIPDPRHSIEWLLAETLGIKRLDLYLKYDRPLSPDELDHLRPLVKRRAQHEPLQYIIGFTDFMNARINVSEEVLIPRIETEQLVEVILHNHPSAEYPTRSVLDIGTGSGCIPIALKMERPDWQVSAFDISEQALRVARSNAEQNDTEISFFQGDIFLADQLDIKTDIDLIVSNPPYITMSEKETLEPQVLTYEPHRALFTEDIREIYRRIKQFSEEKLSESGTLYLELHEHFANSIQEVFEAEKWMTEIQQDYDKNDRFLIGQLR